MELVTIQEADNYFEKRFLSIEYLNLSNQEKEIILTTAENDLLDTFEFRDTAILTPIESVDVKIKKAVFEQAIYLLQNPDLHERLSLLNQGLKKIEIKGVAIEEFNEMGFNFKNISFKSKNLLKTFTKGKTRIVMNPEVDTEL